MGLAAEGCCVTTTGASGIPGEAAIAAIAGGDAAVRGATTGGCARPGVAIGRAGIAAVATIAATAAAAAVATGSIASGTAEAIAAGAASGAVGCAVVADLVADARDRVATYRAVQFNSGNGRAGVE